MMDETLLTAALTLTRAGYDAAQRIGVDANDFGEAARAVLRCATEQYQRDEEQRELNRDVLHAQLTRKYGHGGMTETIMQFVDTFPTDASKVNVTEEYRLMRLARLSTHLATLLATGQHGEETEERLAEYARLRQDTKQEEVKLRLTAADFTDEAGGKRMKLMPPTLNTYIGGGLLPGHNVTVYGRPDSGKSMFALNQAAYACKSGATVLYVANEEPDRDITRRLLSRLINVPIGRLYSAESMGRAIEAAGEAYENFNLLHKAGVTTRDISRLAKRVRPDLIVVDQLKNLHSTGTGDNRALQLDKLAREVRELGILHKAVTISVTQAGDSADQKRVLTMGDIEWSNTGIPGAADLLVGIGVDGELDAQNKRMIALPKNKINGKHGALPVWVDPTITAFLSKARVPE